MGSRHSSDTMNTHGDNDGFYRIYLDALREHYIMVAEYRNMVENYSRMCDNYWQFIQQQHDLRNNLFERMGQSRENQNRNQQTTRPSIVPVLTLPPPSATNVFSGIGRRATPSIYSLTPVFGGRRALSRYRRTAFTETPTEQQMRDRDANSREETRIIDLIGRFLGNNTEESDQPARQYSATDISNVIYHAGSIPYSTCPIGLEDFVEGESISIICGCGHAFKKENLERWLRRNHICPVCRYNIVERRPAENNERDSGLMEFVFNIDMSGNITRENNVVDEEFLRDPAIQRTISNLILGEFASLLSPRRRNMGSSRDQSRERERYDAEVVVDTDSDDDMEEANRNIRLD
jgi:hypothetical protein